MMQKTTYLAACLLALLLVLFVKNAGIEESHKIDFTGGRRTKSISSRRLQEENDGALEQQGEEHETETAHEGHQSYELMVVLFTTVCVLIAALAREISKKTIIETSPILLAVGCIMGYWRSSLGDVGKACEKMTEINPHSLLLVFIPPIIFESAYNEDHYLLKRQLYQVLTLATGGTLISSLLLAFSFAYILGYHSEIPFSACLTLGAILSATSTILVGRILKKIGTPSKINILMQGESLFNNGTAMILYIVFIGIYKNNDVTGFEIIIQVLRFLIGGGVLGALFCGVTIYWISKITRDDMLSIAITFFSCYFSFLFGEMYFGVSGILAVVTLAVLMGMYGSVHINPESVHSLHIVWSYVQFILEAMLYILTGIIIGKEIINLDENSITYTDLWLSLLLFPILILVRFIMGMTLLPLLNLTGYKLSVKDIIVVAYGGIHGAVSICLSLMVFSDTLSNRFQDLVIFFTVIQVLLSILINYPTLEFVIKLINYNQIETKNSRLNSVLNRSLVISAIKRIDALKNNRFYNLVNWRKVNTLTNITNLFNQECEKVKNEADKERQTLIDEVEDESQLIQTRQRIYMFIKSQISERFEMSLCSSHSYQILGEICEFCKEESNENIWLWECSSQYISSSGIVTTLLKWRNVPLLGDYINSYATAELRRSYELLATLIMSVNEVISNHSSLPLPEKSLIKVIDELKRDRTLAEKRLFHLIDTFPNLIRSIQNKQAASIVLLEQLKLIQTNLNQGLINQVEFADLKQRIDRAKINLDRLVCYKEPESTDDLLVVSPGLSRFNKEAKEILCQSKTLVEFQKNQIIYEKKKPIPGVYVIVQGVIKDKLSDDISIKFGMGALINYAHCTQMKKEKIKALTTAIAYSTVTAYLLPADAIVRAFDADNSLMEYCYHQALDYYMKVFPPRNLPFKIEDHHIQDLITNSEVLLFGQDELKDLPLGGFLYYGEIQEECPENREHPAIYNEPSMVRAHSGTYRAIKNSCILRFKVGFGNEALQYADRQSRVHQSLRHSIMRHSIINIANLEADVDFVFKTLIGQKFSEMTHTK